MAKLSNINNLFSVDSTGAIEFSTQVGTTGYVLESRGAGNAPVWTDRDTGRITGSGTDGQVTYWTSGTNITSNSGFTYNAAGRVTSTESFGVSKDGADTVVDGPFFVLKNAAGTRQYANQLDASNNIDYWYYNGTAWTQTISLLNNGGATFAGSVTAVGVSSTIASATSGYFATGTAIPANQILHVRDNVGQVATNSAGGIKISSSPGNDVFLLKRNDGGTSYFALQNSSAAEFITTDMATGNTTFTEQVQVKKTKSGTGVENYDLIRLNLSGTGAVGDSSTIGWFSTTGTKTAGIEGISGLDNILYGELAFHVRRYTTDSYDRVMTINNRGNVGIGTASPVAPLQIERASNTTLALSNSGSVTSGTRGEIAVYNSSISTVAAIKAVVDTSATADNVGTDLTFFTRAIGGSLTQKMVIKGDGKVGIGTTSPGSILDVVDTAGTTTLTLGRSGEVPEIKAGGTNTDLRLSAVGTGGFLQFQTNGSSRMLIQAGGNVGIGITNPAYSLEVNSGSTIGSARLTGTATASELFLGTNNVQSQYTNLVFYSDSGNAQIWKAGSGYSGYGGVGALNIYNSTGAIAFHPAGSANAMYINADANVGIGTSTSEPQRLTVLKTESNGKGIWRFGTSGSTFTHTGHKFFGSITGTNTSNGFYTIGQVADSCSVIIVIKTAAHSCATILASRGYGPSNVARVQILSSTKNANGGYANITAVRISGGGTVDMQLTWSSGPNVSVSVTYYGNGCDLPADLRLSVSDTGTYPYNVTDSAAFKSTAASARVSGELDVNYDLHANGNILVANSKQIQFYNTGQIIYANSNNDLTIQSADDINYRSNFNRFFNGSTEFARLSGAVNSWIANGSNGKLGINRTDPGYTLDVNGTIRATSDIIAYSDERVKENIKTIDNALNKVNKLRGVQFNKIGENTKCIGVVAQEIEKVIPEVVRDDDKGMKSVAYGNITGILIEAIKELKAEIEELKKCKCDCKK